MASGSEPVPESVIGGSTARKRERARRAFNRLLVVLDRNPQRAAAVYISIHKAAILFFENNGCPQAEQLADRVMEVLERKTRGRKKIRNPRGLAYRIGEKLRLRAWRMLKRDSPLSDAKQLAQAEQELEEQIKDSDSSEIECQKLCVGKLDAAERDLIVRYSRETEEKKLYEARKEMARRHKISMGTLRKRICKIRKQLFSCVTECLEGSKGPREHIPASRTGL